jgi:predicted transposase/invertase (TIGR01784 family)
METLKRLPFKARKAVFEKLEKIVDIASLSKEEREKYDESIKVYRDHLATLAYAEQKGMQEGLQKGMQEGLQKGIKEGLQKGKREREIAIAREMKKEGIPIEQIARFTKLSIN